LRIQIHARLGVSLSRWNNPSPKMGQMKGIQTQNWWEQLDYLRNFLMYDGTLITLQLEAVNF